MASFEEEAAPLAPAEADVALGASVDASADVGFSVWDALVKDAGGSGADVGGSHASEALDFDQDSLRKALPEDESALLIRQVTPSESKMAQELSSQVDATRAPLYAELLNQMAGKSSLKRGSSSSSLDSSSGPMQLPQKKMLKAHVSVSSDDMPKSEMRCDFVCLPCAMAGVPPILDCCLQRGHGEGHLCILCLEGKQQGETSSAVTGLPLPVDDTQS